jgi:polyhydroxybutyrate depolymerase
MAWLAAALAAAGPSGLESGDQLRMLQVDGRARSYLVHVPLRHDPARPTAVVLALHGAAMNAQMMALYSGLNRKADEAGFLAVYPNGTGKFGLLLVWNSGGLAAADSPWPDDVRFIARVLDDLGAAVCIDAKRVYATGFSNGGMMCYRLAAELSDRIAAIAPVAGTMAVDCPTPRRPVSVIHFHGTEDSLVPVEGLRDQEPRFLTFKSVEESIRCWAAIDGCRLPPVVRSLPDVAHDGTRVDCARYAFGRGGTEVELWTITGGGHAWPGRPAIPTLRGKSTRNISANDLIWDFFRRHPMP